MDFLTTVGNGSMSQNRRGIDGDPLGAHRGFGFLEGGSRGDGLPSGVSAIWDGISGFSGAVIRHLRKDGCCGRGLKHHGLS
jgi:hypothetical protein